MSSLYSVGKANIQSDGKLIAPVKFDLGEAELYSAKLSINYDPKQVKPSSVIKSDETKDYSLVFNKVEDGLIEVAIAGSKPLKGSGKLMDVSFEPIVKKLRSTNLEIKEGNINDESIIVKALKANKANNQQTNTKVRWTTEALGNDLTHGYCMKVQKEWENKVIQNSITLK